MRDDLREARSLVASELAAFLNGLTASTASPRLVETDGRVHPAAWFEQMRELPDGSRARSDAVKAHAPTTYVHDGLYVQGRVPNAYGAAHARHEHDQIRFVEVEGGQQWSLASWADTYVVGREPALHPFGEWFLLQRVAEPGDAADEVHIPMRVHEL